MTQRLLSEVPPLHDYYFGTLATVGYSYMSFHRYFDCYSEQVLASTAMQFTIATPKVNDLN